MSKLTTEQIIVQFKNVHGDRYDYSEVEYVNDITKVIIVCPIEKHGSFSQTPNKHKNGQGCPKCMGKNLTLEEKQNLIGYGKIELIEEFKKEHGAKRKKVTYIKYKCLTKGCEYIGEMSWDSIRRGCGCSACRGFTVTKNNSVTTKRPDLVKYFLNPKEANSLTVSSNKKIQTICPFCKTPKNKTVTVKNLSNYPYSCHICGDKIPITEKFVARFLSQMNIDFKTRQPYIWSQRKEYDFIFKINEENTICEVHGIQHYIQSNRGKTLKEEQENDKLKYDLAIQNGVKNYIVVDCRYSTFEWLKENCIKSFSPYYELSNVNWEDIWMDSQKSIKLEIWCAWNDRKENDTIISISEKFGLDKTTIRKYLKDGTAIGMCQYTPRIRVS